MSEPTHHVRQAREIPPGSPADTCEAELAEKRIRLDTMRVHHLDLMKRVLADDLYETDLFFIAVMARSYGLVDGFISAFDTWNPAVMAPLIRLQIDSLVRVAYLAKAPHVEKLALHIIGGGEFRSLNDSDGKPLTDRRLNKLAAQSHPWIDAVYKATSGWVHFSPAHVYAAVQLEPEGSAEDSILKLFGGIPIRPEQIPLSALDELIEAMIQATTEIFAYVVAWGKTKDAKRAARGES